MIPELFAVLAASGAASIIAATILRFPRYERTQETAVTGKTQRGATVEKTQKGILTISLWNDARTIEIYDQRIAEQLLRGLTERVRPEKLEGVTIAEEGLSEDRRRPRRADRDPPSPRPRPAAPSGYPTLGIRARRGTE